MKLTWVFAEILVGVVAGLGLLLVFGRELFAVLTENWSVTVHVHVAVHGIHVAVHAVHVVHTGHIAVHVSVHGSVHATFHVSHGGVIGGTFNGLCYRGVLLGRLFFSGRRLIVDFLVFSVHLQLLIS